MSADVVESERKRCEQRSQDTKLVETQGRSGLPGSYNADRQRDSSDRHHDGSRFLQGEFLLSAGHHVEKYPHWRRILQDDGSGDVRFLNGQVIKIIGRGDSEDTQQQALNEIGPG